jgi:FdhE protein
MAETFLPKWLGGKTTSPAAEEARAQIDRLLADPPNYRGPLAWLRAVMDELVPDPGSVVFTRLSTEAARENLSAGQAIFFGQTPQIDRRRFARRWQRLCDALAESQHGAIPRGLASAAERGTIDPNRIAAAWLRPDRDEQRTLQDIARQTACDPALLATLARFALFPGFVAAAVAAAPLWQGVTWERGYCPVCGCPPLLGEFRGIDQSRFLRCGLCAASWEAPRQWCPACGNRNHKSLGFLSKEGEEARYRVATCDACRSGIKTVSSLSALPPLLILVADASTLHLDLAAADHGYSCPPAGALPKHILS